MGKFKLSALLALLAIFLLVLPASADANLFPDLILLPNGFQPEGIARGQGATFYTGSLADGNVIRGSLVTGETSVLVPGQTGMVSTGMYYDRHSHALFVSGGGTGMARVFNADTGELLKSYQLAPAAKFINDVVVTREAAYFTNSSQAVLYRVPLGPDGSLPDAADVETVPLSGEWEQVANAFNANGIEATRDGKWLVVVNSTVGNLYRVDPDTGEAVAIDLGGQSLTNGDGLRFHHGLLYVVRNMNNQIAVVDLSGDLTSGTVVDTLTNPNLDVPTTVAAFDHALYAVNARFGAANPTTIPYEVVRVPLKQVARGERFSDEASS